jgi:hypothetical protein
MKADRLRVALATLAEGAVGMTDVGAALDSLTELVSLSPIVEEFRVWTLTDPRGSWPCLIDGARPGHVWTHAELWDACPTYEEALCALWQAQQELRATGRDRRKQERRRHARPGTDRRLALDAAVWTPLP